MNLSADCLVIGIVGVLAAAAMSTKAKWREKRRTDMCDAPNAVDMKYDDGTEMRLGDRVRIKGGASDVARGAFVHT